MLISLPAMRPVVVIYVVPLFFLFSPALVLRGDLTPPVYVLPSVIISIVLLSGGLNLYLLGVGRARALLHAPLAIAGFAFSFSGRMIMQPRGGMSAILVALVWAADKNSEQPAM